METWKPIPGFIGYDISSHGRVRSYRGTGKSRVKVFDAPQRILHPFGDSNHYPQVVLCFEGKYKSFAIHRLALLTFVGPCPKGCHACHNDGNKFNNNIINLRWDTRRSNENDKFKHGTNLAGEKNGMVKLSESQIMEMRRLYKYGHKIASLARMFNIVSSAAANIIHRRRWKHLP